MEIRQLRTFLTVAKVGTFTQAAELLDYAQSSISAQICSLEDELGVKIFERLGRHISLTREGKKLIIYAEKILQLVLEAKDTLSDHSVPRGTLIIGAPESLCTFRLPSLLQECHRLYPEVEIVIRLGTCCDIIHWLREDIIDIAFLLDKEINLTGLTSEILIQEPLILVANPAEKLIKNKITKLGSIRGKSLILTERGCYRDIFEDVLKDKKIIPGPITELGSVEAIKKCVGKGLGISLLPRMTVETEITDGHLAGILLEDLDLKIYTQMVYRNDKWMSSTLLRLIDLARRVLVDTPYPKKCIKIKTSINSNF